MQNVLDESGYSAMLKNKKDLENENRLENIKELLSAMKEFYQLSFYLLFLKKKVIYLLMEDTQFKLNSNLAKNLK